MFSLEGELPDGGIPGGGHSLGFGRGTRCLGLVCQLPGKGQRWSGNLPVPEASPRGGTKGKGAELAGAHCTNRETESQSTSGNERLSGGARI